MTDPVTAYANAVVSGQEIAARLVVLACQRHLDDLEHGPARGLEWKPDEAQRVIDFFAEVLCLPENTDAGEEANDGAALSEESKPFVLSPFQQFIAGSLFGWFKGSRRRYRVAYVETAKGSGKTPFGAGLMLYMLVADGERGAQVYMAAVTKDQAKLAYTDAERMVLASPSLAVLVDQKVNNLAVLATGSFLRPIASETKTLDGKRVHGALIDEEHEHPDETVYLKMRAGTKGRRNALILVITNSGFDLGSVCWRHHEYSRGILSGEVQNDAWFAFVCHLDACAKCQSVGLWQPSDDCPDCDDWTTEGPHYLKANPNLGISLPWQYLREQVREAIDIPSQRNMVRRLNFCQWTQGAVVGIPPEKWAACKGAISSASLVGRDCIIGIDLSDKIDLSSVVLIFPRPMSKPVSVEGGEAPVTVDWATDVIPYFWMPRSTLQRRAQEDGTPYPDWVRQGHIFDTPGDIVDHDAIVDFICNVVAKKYRVRRIGFDQAGATAAVTRLRRHFGTFRTAGREEEVVIEIPQSFRSLSGATKLVQALAISGQLQHDGNPCMAWCIGNMGFEENYWREIRPVKLDQRKRIDGGVALIDAHAALLQTNVEPKKSYAIYGLGGGVHA